MNLAERSTRERTKTDFKVCKHLCSFTKEPVSRHTWKVWFLAFLAFFFTVHPGSSQNWTWQNPLPQGNNLNGVCFPDTNTGYSVGADGMILKTTNGGLNWALQNSGTTNSLVDVFFTDADTGYAIGGASTLLKTTNGGMNWTAQTVSMPYLTSLFFTSADTGYLVGGSGSNGVILKTTNGGINWIVQPSGSNPFYNSVYFPNDSTGYVVGNSGKILKTTNGGASWIAQTSGVTTSLYSVYFTSPNNGFVSEYGRILRTTNGGASWSYLTIFQSYELYSLYFTDAQTGYVVGRTGKILKTTNGGVSWALLTSGTSITLRSVWFTTANQGHAVGENGIMLKTMDAGVTWTPFLGGAYFADLNGVYFPNACTGYAVGNQGALFKTSSGGAQWTTQNSLTTNNLRSVFFPTDVKGYAVGDTGKIITTTNGGTTWVTQTSGTTNTLYSVCFVNSDTGYAVGNIGTILKTINGGTSWTLQTSGVSNNLHSVYFINDSTGFAAGTSGRILKTINGGTTWSILYSGTTLDLRTVCFPTADTGYVAGVSGHIRKTVNGGTNWTQLTNNINYVITSLSFIDGTKGYAVGYDYNDNGKIYKTVNGGVNWTVQNISPEHDLHSVQYADANTVFIVGLNGTILRSILGVSSTTTNYAVLCEGAPLTLSASSVSGATYLWTGPNGFTSTLQNPTVSTHAADTMSGTYAVSATMNGCTSLTEITMVIVHPSPSAPTAGNNGPVCEGAPLTLSASSVSGATYLWTGPNGFTSALQNPTISSAATTTMSGYYMVSAAKDGCTSSNDSTIVAVHPIPATPIAGNNGPVCEGTLLTLSASTVSGASYLWTGPNGFTSALQNPTISSAATTTMSGSYMVSAAKDGCTSSNDSTIVAVHPIPATPIAGNNGPVAVGSALTLTASAVPGATYAWTGPDGFASSLQNPIVSTNTTPAMAGIYEVTATVNACTSPAGSTLVIVDSTIGLAGMKPEAIAKIFPNPAFDLIAITTEMQSVHVQIFNAIGECVLQSDFGGPTNFLDISSLEPGLYVIRLTGAQGTYQQKLIRN
jgi:photosystem II stability/assembly factor-like uncharacterized protein